MRIFELRFAICACVLALSPMRTSAQEASPWITLNGKEAHPTRILAKFNDPGKSTDRFLPQAVITQSGNQLAHRYQGVSGLVLFDEIPSAQAPRGGYQPGKPAQVAKLEARLAALRATGMFEYVEADYVWRASLEPGDPAFLDGTQWGLRNLGKSVSGGKAGADISAEAAWDVTTGSEDVVVAVIDTGVRYTHVQLASQMWINEGEVPDNGLDDDLNGWIDDIHGINAILNTGDPLDVDDHGTFVAGIIGAVQDDQEVVGVSWNSKIMACKFLGPFGGVTSDAIKCIDYATANGAHIMNNSWGGGPFSNALLDSIRNANANDILFVVASGNSGLDNDVFPQYPTNYEVDNVISVGAMDRFDEIADFSNFGKTTVDIVAPGVEIYSTGSGDPPDTSGAVSVDPDEDYDLGDGTSFAAPYVSGVAALLRSLFDFAPLSEIKNRILDSAVKAPPYLNKVATGGRVNAAKALEINPDGVLEVSVNPPSQSVLLAGSSQTVTVRVTDIIGILNAEVSTLLPDGTVVTHANDGVAPDIKADDALYTADIQLPDEEGTFQIVVTANAPDKTGVSVTIIYQIIEAPVNDNFVDAIKVAPGGASFISNNQFATLEENEPLHAGANDNSRSLWWSWSPRQSGSVIIDTAGSEFDTVIAVYEGNSLEDLTPVASVNNIDGLLAGYLVFDVNQGTGYRIAVASANNLRGGSLRVRFQPGGQPDRLPPVVQIQEPLNGFISTERQLLVSGFAFDPQPAASGIQAISIVVNGELAGGNATGFDNWSGVVFLKPGINEIEVVATDFARNQSEVDQIVVNYFVSDPVNDHFQTPEILAGLEGQVEVDTTGATRQFAEPLHAGNRGGASVWYRFTPEVDGILTLNTVRTRFDTLLAVYTGSKMTDLVRVASNDDSGLGAGASQIIQALQGGVTYHIALDGFSGEFGVTNLRYEYVGAGIREISVTSSEGGEVVGPAGLVTDGSEVTFTAVPAPGFEFKGWSGSFDSPQNPLTFMVDSNVELHAEFGIITVGDDFESGGFTLNLTFEGVPWTVTDEDGFSGDSSARSGMIGHSQTSAMILRDEFAAGRGRFDFKVSSEEGWDLFEFLIDGRLVGKWSGEVDWQRFEFALKEGEHELVWRYRKDFANSEGADAVFVDNIDVPLDVPAAVAPLEVTVSQDRGMLRVRVQGAAGQPYLLEGSKDLSNWRTMAEGVTGQDGSSTLEGAYDGIKKLEFFRAKSR